MQEMQVLSLICEDPLEEGMATHSSILAGRIPWTQEPGGLLSMALQRVGHTWATDSFTFNVNRWKIRQGALPFSLSRPHISHFSIPMRRFSPRSNVRDSCRSSDLMFLCPDELGFDYSEAPLEPQKNFPQSLKGNGESRQCGIYDDPGHTLLDGGLPEEAHMWMLAQLVERGARQKGRPASVEPRIVALRACFEDILSASVAERKPVLTPGVGNCFFDLCSIAFVTERVES